MLTLAFYAKTMIRFCIAARVALFSRRKETGLRALAAKCKLPNMEEESARDLFITHMTDLQLQKKLFVEQVVAVKILKTALAWESGLENQKLLAKLVKAEPHYDAKPVAKYSVKLIPGQSIWYKQVASSGLLDPMLAMQSFGGGNCPADSYTYIITTKRVWTRYPRETLCPPDARN